MSPFIVTMIRSCNCDPSTCESDGLLYHETRCSVFNVPRGERESRLAVATLEEARTEVFDCLTATEDLAQHYGGAADRLAKSIEPGEYIKAPDGTTIQVEPVRWIALALANADADISGWTTDTDWQTRALAAFNAKHARVPDRDALTEIEDTLTALCPDRINGRRCGSCLGLPAPRRRTEGVYRMNLLERNKDLARWFRDLRNRAEIGQVTPPPSIVDMIERLMEETAAEQLRGAVSDVTTARSLLHDFALDRGSTDGLSGVFEALNTALTRLGGQ